MPLWLRLAGPHCRRRVRSGALGLAATVTPVAHVDGVPFEAILFVEPKGAFLGFVWYDERPDRLPRAEELERWRDFLTDDSI